ncbi:MAG: hypothetical protein ACJ76Z_16175 [Thermoleophilaceae bacterium]
MDAFEQWVRGGLEHAGVGAEDVDVEIAAYIEQLYGPELRALVEADMNGLWPEPDLDPSRAPTS